MGVAPSGAIFLTLTPIVAISPSFKEAFWMSRVTITDGKTCATSILISGKLSSGSNVWITFADLFSGKFVTLPLPLYDTNPPIIFTSTMVDEASCETCVSLTPEKIRSSENVC